MSALIEADNLSLAYGRARPVDRVSLTVAAGELTVVVGPNGAGKTSLMKLLTGEVRPTEGRVLIEGMDMAAVPAWQLASRRAVMAQATRLAFPFTVAEVVRIGIDGVGRAMTRPARERIIAGALEAADVTHLAARNYQTLSGGEQQRVQFARAFAQLRAGTREGQRQVLFLDEPVASLDLTHQVALMERAAELAHEGLAVIAVLHDLNLAATFADRVVVMHRGRAHASGTPREVITRPVVADIFGVDLCREAEHDGGLPVVLPQNYTRLQARARAERGAA